MDIDGTKAVYFDGVDDYATIPSFDIRSTDFTIALWIKADGTFGIINNVFNDIKDSVRQFTTYFHYGSFTFSTYDDSNTKVFGIRNSARYDGCALIVKTKYSNNF